MKNKINPLSLPKAIATGALIASFAITAPAFAEMNTQSGTHQGRSPGRGTMWQKQPGVFGTVASVSGNTLTVTSKKIGKDENGASTTYTVDATNATVIKSGATSTVAGIAIGDTVMVMGTVSGASVTATKVIDGLMRPGSGMMNGGSHSTTTPPVIEGNGQPIIAGSVSAISGTTLTITNKSNVTYTVDATNAKVQKGMALGALSSVAVGDNVIVQGTVNGNSVIASSVIDQGQIPAMNTTTGGAEKSHMGFFGGIGSFFAHIFGF